MKRIISSSLAIALCVASASAAIPSWEALKKQRVESDKSVVWEQVSPGNSGYTNLVRFHPTIAGKLMVCPDMWSAFQTDDYGKKWYALTDYDGDASFYHILDLNYSVSDPNTGIAICSSELWLTRNMGKNWEVVKRCPWYKPDVEGRDEQSWQKKVGAIAIDPNDANHWFVAGGSFIRGQEWKSNNMVTTLAHPRGVPSLNQGKMWSTTDGGESWSVANNGIHPEAQIVRIIVSPKSSKQIFAASDHGVFRSNDGGKSWRSVSKGKLESDIIMDMDRYYDPKSGTFILYAIDQVQYHAAGDTTRCTGGIYESRDDGETWRKINGNLGLDLNRLSGGVPLNYYKYITRWFKEGELKSVPKYSTQKEIAATQKSYPKLPTYAVQPFKLLVADPSKEGRIYVGFFDPQIHSSFMPGRLWVTHDGGEKWINTARLYEDTWGKDKEYWEERGNPWHENMKVGHQSPHMRNGKDYPLRSLRGLDVGVDGAVMITSDHSTMLSRDNGESWQQMDEDLTPQGGIVGHGNSNMCVVQIVQDRRDPKLTAIASSEHHTWLCEEERYNGSISIRQRPTAPETSRCIAFDPLCASTLYCTSARQTDKQYIFKSTDSGETWEKHGVATPATNKWMDDFYTNSLLIDPVNPKYFYHGITTIEDKSKVKQGGVYRSSDGGLTFEQVNSGLPEIARVKSIVFDPRDKSNKSLFAGVKVYTSTWRAPKTTKGGLYHTTDRGDSWQSIALPKGVESVQQIMFDNTERMYITTGHTGGTGGDGIWQSDDFGETWEQIFKEANATCFAVSPFDNHVIATSVCSKSRNPGFYISCDRGETWSKSNTNIVIPHQVTSINFDLHKPNRMWLSVYGAGAYRGIVADGVNEQLVDIEQRGLDLSVGGRETLQVKTELKEKSLRYFSENNNIAKVDKKGVVTAGAAGATKVWVSDGRYSDYVVVVVK